MYHTKSRFPISSVFPLKCKICTARNLKTILDYGIKLVPLEIIQNGFKDSSHHSRATTSILAYMVLFTAIPLMLWSFKLQQSNLVFWIQLYQDIRTGEF